MEVDVVLYMKEPPDGALLRRMAAGMDGPVEDLVRKDSQFKKLELVSEDYVDNLDAVVELLGQRKALMQRPLLVRGDLASEGPLEACVGRPREKLYEFLGACPTTEPPR